MKVNYWALNTFVKDENLKKKIEEMKIHEKEHCEYFENEIKKRNIKPTKFLPLWDLLGVGTWVLVQQSWERKLLCYALLQ